MTTNPVDLSVTYLGLTLPNPIIAASCGLTANLERVRAVAQAGAGAVVLKSIFEEQVAAEVARLERVADGSDYHPEAADYIRTYGKAQAVDGFLKLIGAAKQATRVPIIASVHCVSASEWVGFARQCEDAGADALELNVHVVPDSRRRTGRDIDDACVEIVAAVRARTRLPLAIKIAPYFSHLPELTGRLVAAGANGLVLFNRFYRVDVDVEAMSPVAGDQLSTPSDASLPLRWIALLSGRVRCDFVTSGGVHDGSGAVKQLLAGAQAVQVCSTLYRHGLPRIGEMVDDLGTWMSRHGYPRVADFRGQLNALQTINAEHYERLQYMQRATAADRD